jgi:hypothetical protein
MAGGVSRAEQLCTNIEMIFDCRFAEHVRRTLFECQNLGYLTMDTIKLPFHVPPNTCYEYNRGMVIYMIKVQMPQPLFAT